MEQGRLGVSLATMFGTVDQVLEAFGGPLAFGEALGVGRLAYDFKRRSSIPVAYWPRIIEAAQARGIGVSVSTLVYIHTGKRISEPWPADRLAFCGFATIVACMVGFAVGLLLGYLRSLA